MLNATKQKLSPYRMHIIASILLGGNAIAIKVVTNQIDPVTVIAIRYLIVGSIIAFIYRKNIGNLSVQGLRSVLISSVLVIIFALTYYIGIQYTTALKAGLILLITPLVLYIIAITFLKEKFIMKVLIGSLIGLAGSLINIGSPIFTAGSFNKGDIMLFAGSCILAAHMAFTKYSFKYCSFYQILSLRQIIAGVSITLYILASGSQTNLDNLTLTGVLALIHLIFIGGVLGLLMFYSSLRKLRVEDTAPIYYLVPLTTIIIAAVGLGESLSYSDYIGATIILFGVALAHPHHHHVLHRMHVPEQSRLQKIVGFFKNYLHAK